MTNKIVPIEKGKKRKEGSWEETLAELGKQIDEDIITDFACVALTKNDNGGGMFTTKWFGNSLLCSGLLGAIEILKEDILQFIREDN